MKKNWVCCPNTEGKSNLLVCFRREIVCTPGEDVKICIHANQSYKLYWNGEFVGRGGVPSCAARPYYIEWNVKAQEKNCIAAEVYAVGENIVMVTEQNKGQLCLNAEVYAGSELYCTDESWQCCPAPGFFNDYMLDPMANRISAWGGYKEVWDTRMQSEAWKSAGFDAVGWTSCIPCERANREYGVPERYDLPLPRTETALVPQLLQSDGNLGKIEIGQNAVLLDGSAPGSFPAVIYDFGREVVGYVHISAEGEAESSLSLWYGESFDMLRTDTFILRGGRQMLEPFQRRAFRYLKISVNGGAVPTAIYTVTLDLTHFPLEEKQRLIFSDELLQRVYDVSLYTTKLASQYHFEDSVYREQMQWLLDARIMALVHYECFGESRLAEKAIRQFCRTQREDGCILGAGPQPCNQVLPDYCLHFVMMVREYLRYTNSAADEEILAALKKLFDWLEANESDDGLLDTEGKRDWWCFLDWAPLDKRGKVTALNCLYVQALRSYAEILRGSGAQKYVQKAQRLRRQINAKMFDSARGLYCDCIVQGVKSSSYSQQTNIYALICGVAEEPAKLCKKITADDFNGVRINGAFLMCISVEYLLSNGEKDTALRWIDRYWGEMLRRGATAWWETFDPTTSRSSVPFAYSRNNATYLHEYIPVSYCHAWGAGVAHSLAKAKRCGLL